MAKVKISDAERLKNFRLSGVIEGYKRWTVKQLEKLEVEDVLKMDTVERAYVADALSRATKTRLRNIEKSGLFSNAQEKLRENFEDFKNREGTPIAPTDTVLLKLPKETKYSRQDYIINPTLAEFSSTGNALTSFIARELDFIKSKTSTVTGIKDTNRRQSIAIFGAKTYKEVRDKDRLVSPAASEMFEKTDSGHYQRTLDYERIPGKRYYEPSQPNHLLSNDERKLFWQVVHEIEKTEKFKNYKYKYLFQDIGVFAWAYDEDKSFQQLYTEAMDALYELYGMKEDPTIAGESDDETGETGTFRWRDDTFVDATF